MPEWKQVDDIYQLLFPVIKKDEPPLCVDLCGSRKDGWMVIALDYFPWEGFKCKTTKGAKKKALEIVHDQIKGEKNYLQGLLKQVNKFNDT